jgi:hypothetical protein
MTGKILVSAAIAALLSSFAPAGAATAPVEQPQWVGQGALVRQDFADCQNTGVTSDPARNGGMIKVLRREDGTTFVEVAYTNGTPNTTYEVFQKCVASLGQVHTNAKGHGFKTFRLKTNPDTVLTFDSYPNGAPAGNKFQSVQIHLTPLPPSVHPITH